MKILALFALSALGFSGPPFSQATVLLKKPQSCEEFKALLRNTMFKAECQDFDKKTRAYTVTYLGSESLTTALATLRKNGKVAAASPMRNFEISR